MLTMQVLRRSRTRGGQRSGTAHLAADWMKASAPFFRASVVNATKSTRTPLDGRLR